MRESTSHKFAQMIKRHPRRAGLLAVAVVAVLIVGISFMLSGNGGISVVGQTADLKLVPAASTLTPGAQGTVTLKVNTNDITVNGVQVYLNITGTIPTDLVFNPADLSSVGLSLVSNSLNTTATGKQLVLAYITASPTVPFKNNTDLAIGILGFTVPASGSMTLTFDVTRTKINDWTTLQNVAAYPGATTYTFSAGTNPPPTITGALKVSTKADRSGSVALDGYSAAVGSVVYVWLDSNTTGPVDFLINASAYKTDSVTPFDLNGTAADGSAVGLTLGFTGTYTIKANFSGQSAQGVITVLTTPPPTTNTGVLKVSTSADRAGSVDANGYSNTAGVPLFVWLETNATGSVEFYINGTLTQTEGNSPYDLTGTNSATTNANPWNPAAATYQIQAKFNNLTQTANATITINTAPTNPPPTTGINCGEADIDGNTYLDIVDFADFAAKYNETCATSSTPQTPNPTPAFDYILGSQMSLAIMPYGVTTYNAVDLDITVTNATVTGFVPETTAGWLSAIGLCDAQGSLFTANRVCAALSKSARFLDGERVGTLQLKLDKLGTVRIEYTNQTKFSDGTNSVSKPGFITEFTVGQEPPPGTGGAPVCGMQDANADSLISVIDLSRFARKYRQTNCQATF